MILGYRKPSLFECELSLENSCLKIEDMLQVIKPITLQTPKKRNRLNFLVCLVSMFAGFSPLVTLFVL